MLLSSPKIETIVSGYIEAFLAKQSQQSYYWKGASVFYACSQRKSIQNRDFFYNYGYDFLGPAYSVYIHKLIEKIQKYKIDHILFIAREGFLFKKLYELLLPYLSKSSLNTTTSYAFLSRRSTFLASAFHLATKEIVFGINKVNQQGLFSIFKTYGLPCDPFVNIAAEYGIELKETISDFWNNEILLSFFGDIRVQELISKYQKSAHEELKTYLNQCQFFGKNRKVALVDIGWEGTIQNNLVQAFGHMEDFPLLYGFYFGKREEQGFLRYSSSFSEGLIYDSRNRDINEQSISTFVEIFEQSARAPHGSTIGYRVNETNGRIIPELKNTNNVDRQNEILANPIISIIQKGIVDFASSYGEISSLHNYSSDEIKPFVLTIISKYINFPTQQEAVNIISTITHSEDLGEDNSRSLGIKQFDFLSGKHWLSLTKKIKSSLWKQGTISVINIPGILFLYVIQKQLKYYP